MPLLRETGGGVMIKTTTTTTTVFRKGITNMP